MELRKSIPNWNSVTKNQDALEEKEKCPREWNKTMEHLRWVYLYTKPDNQIGIGWKIKK